MSSSFFIASMLFIVSATFMRWLKRMLNQPFMAYGFSFKLALSISIKTPCFLLTNLCAPASPAKSSLVTFGTLNFSSGFLRTGNLSSPTSLLKVFAFLPPKRPPLTSQLPIIAFATMMAFVLMYSALVVVVLCPKSKITLGAAL